MIRIISKLLGISVLTGVAFYGYYGGFIKPGISITTSGGETLIYEKIVGDYFSLIKVYPALNKFALENGLSDDSAVMEIYDIPNKKIIYQK
jgi:hypothetical protein